MKNRALIIVSCFLYLGVFLNACTRQSGVDEFLNSSSSSGSRNYPQTRARERSPAPQESRPVQQSSASSTSANSAPAQSDSSTKPNVKFVSWSQKPAANNSRTYTVQKGDSLFAIARKLYGEADAWKLIYQANREIISDPGNLPAGVELQIP